jgi:hypothetical protein
MCDRCDSKEEFTGFDLMDGTNYVKLCIKCVRLWVKIYHATYPKGSNGAEWTKLFLKFVRTKPSKIKVILI